jgi:hypothetical protein
MLPARPVGQCDRCHKTIGWFGYLRRKLGSHSAVIKLIADLARVTTRPCA